MDRPLLFKLVIGTLIFFLGYGYASRRDGEEREVEHEHAHETTDIRVMGALLNERYPLQDGDPAHVERKWNVDAIERLASCTELGTCTEAEHTVVILASYHYGAFRGRGREEGIEADRLGNALHGRVSGENVW